MLEADSQNYASAPSVPRGFKRQNFRPAFGRDHRGTVGGRGVVPAKPPSHPPFSDPPLPPSFSKSGPSERVRSRSSGRGRCYTRQAYRRSHVHPHLNLAVVAPPTHPPAPTLSLFHARHRRRRRRRDAQGQAAAVVSSGTTVPISRTADAPPPFPPEPPSHCAPPGSADRRTCPADAARHPPPPPPPARPEAVRSTGGPAAAGQGLWALGLPSRIRRGP